MERFEGSRLRRGRCSEPRRIYLVTTVTHQRVPVFRDFGFGRSLVNVLRRSDRLGLSRTWGYVVMPDYLHWLFSLDAQAHLSQVVGAAKSLSARAIEVERLWQRGFHDRALRADEDLRASARYVVANPLRAGLVERIGEYPLWDAAWLGDDSAGEPLSP